MQDGLDWKGRRRQTVLPCGPKRPVAGGPTVARELAEWMHQARRRWKAMDERTKSGCDGFSADCHGQLVAQVMGQSEET